MSRGTVESGYGLIRLLGAFLLLLCLGGLAAASEEDTAQQKQETSPLAIILHLTGPEADHKTALGLHLLLAEQVRTVPKLRVASRYDVLDAAEKGRIKRPLDLIHLRDVPYLCLKADSQKALLGWFEVDGETVTLSLRAYDGVSRAYLGGQTLHQPVWKLPALLEQAREIVEEILQRKAERPAAIDPKLSLPALEALGSAWSASPAADVAALLAGWRRDGGQSPDGPAQREAAARLAVQSKDPEAIVSASLDAAEAWIKARRPDLANSHLLSALAAGAEGVTWARLRPDAADEALRRRIAEALPAPTDDPEPFFLSLIRGHLAKAEGEADAAVEHYTKATEATTDHADAWHEAGLLAFARQEIDRAISLLQQAERIDETDDAIRLALARVYARAQFCDRALPLSTEVYRNRPANPAAALHHAGVQQTCRRYNEAVQTVSGIFAYNPEHAPALLRLESLYRELGNEAKVKETQERLRQIDPRAGEEKQKAQAAEQVAETPATAMPPAPQRPRTVEVTFPMARNLAQAIPEAATVVGLVDMDRVETGLGARIARFFVSPTRLDGRLLEEDLEALLRARGGRVVTDSGLVSRITLGSGTTPFTPGSFSSAITHYQLDAIVLYRLSRADKGTVQVDLYGYERGATQVLQAQGLITSRSELLVSFNWGIIVLPLLVLLGIAAFVLVRIRQGTGSVEIAISYSSTFEDGYFAVRLSKRELDQAFNVDPLMAQPFAGTRVDTEARIRKFFASRNPLKTMVHSKLARLDKVPPGNYYAYVVGIMVNVDTRIPIGSHETRREVTVEKDAIAKLDVNLEQTEAYIEFKALRQVIKKRKVMESVEGKMVEVERDITHFEEVGGVMIEVNNDPALTKVTIAGEAVGYYLPQGVYRILASYEDLGAAHLLEITDTSPQQIDLRLVPRREVKIPELPAQQAAPAQAKQKQPQAAAAQPEAPLRAPAAAPRPGIAPSSKLAPEPIELAEDILEGPVPVMLDNSPAIGESTQIPVDIDDLFTAESEVPVSEMMGLGDSPLSENERQESIRRARQMQTSGRYEEAAELFLRAGQLDEAAEMCQKSGNQALNYKIYGISYLRGGQHREAAEMFKYADEPLLEAEALEGLRLFDEANRKRGSYFEQRGDWGRALKHYQKASAFDRIGELHERLQNHEQAGEAFFKARLFDRAGMCFEMAEDTKHAAEAYEMDGNFEKAAELYRKLGSNVKVFNLLEKSGRYFEAAEGYKKFGLLDEAVHACQQVPPNSPDYLRAALIMGKIFVEKDETHLARSVYFKVVSNAEIDTGNIERHYEFAVLIQEQGMIHEAYTLFERLQTVRYNYADVTIRLQHLADQIERERAQHGTAPPPGTVPPFPGYRTSSAGLSATGFRTPTPVPRPAPSSNRYTFERELGRGAMGIVYMARDTALDRSVAYKTVSNAIKDNPASLKYFLSEAKSLAALNHQNIVTVYDVGQEEHNYYITMELVDGRSLGEFIREKGRLSLKNVVVIATKICSGLEYAHSRSVIHRDIKPSNIMISNQGDVKIMDFGLAKIMNDAVQDRTIVRGTPLYMAPEQVEGVGVDHRSDIYSFGVTLFEMATGTLPFTKGDIAYHHLHTPPPSPIRYNPSIPEGLEKLILKCLEKNKETRYQRVADIKRDLAPLRSAIARS